MEVECATLDEVEEALDAGATRILLDNMAPAELRAAVALVARPRRARGLGRGHARRPSAPIAETGVDFISVGALTHSAPSLDVALMLDP